MENSWLEGLPYRAVRPRTGRYIPVHQLTGTWTTHYRTVPSTEGGRKKKREKKKKKSDLSRGRRKTKREKKRRT
ncbi:hypothetical protein GW17_00052553 [Ensete ventricosum]|nr:hypothetical protein GW17_00052553 [Ensete ventricosum]